MVNYEETDIIIADIPGIIEGASEGAGLGIRFLKHISRTSCLIFMIDVSDENYLTAYKTLCGELKSFSEELFAKPRIVLCNKIDVEGARERADEVIAQIKKEEKDTVVLAISVMANEGLGATRKAVIDLVDRLVTVADIETGFYRKNYNILVVFGFFCILAVCFFFGNIGVAHDVEVGLDDLAGDQPTGEIELPLT